MLCDGHLCLLRCNEAVLVDLAESLQWPAHFLTGGPDTVARVTAIDVTPLDPDLVLFATDDILELEKVRTQEGTYARVDRPMR